MRNGNHDYGQQQARKLPNANTGEAATKNNNSDAPMCIGDCNGLYLETLLSIHWRASLVPAAAVIPAPRAYINVVAVKKPVVGFEISVSDFCSRFIPGIQNSRNDGGLLDAGMTSADSPVTRVCRHFRSHDAPKMRPQSSL